MQIFSLLRRSYKDRFQRSEKSAAIGDRLAEKKVPVTKFQIPTTYEFRRRKGNNIRIDLKEMGVNSRNWIDSAQDRDYWRALVNAALNLQVP